MNEELLDGLLEDCWKEGVRRREKEERRKKEKERIYDAC